MLEEQYTHFPTDPSYSMGFCQLADETHDMTSVTDGQNLTIYALGMRQTGYIIGQQD